MRWCARYHFTCRCAGILGIALDLPVFDQSMLPPQTGCCLKLLMLFTLLDSLGLLLLVEKELTNDTDGLLEDLGELSVKY